MFRGDSVLQRQTAGEREAVVNIGLCEIGVVVVGNQIGDGCALRHVIEDDVDRNSRADDARLALRDQFTGGDAFGQLIIDVCSVLMDKHTRLSPSIAIAHQNLLPAL